MYDLDELFSGSLTASGTNETTAGAVVSLFSSTNSALSYLPLKGFATLAVNLSGSFSATVQFEASISGSVWVAISGIPAGGGAAVSSATATGNWLFPFGGYRYFRVRCSTFSSGPVVVAVNASVASTPASTQAASSVASWTDRSGTITSGTTAQTLMAANPTRKGLMIINPLNATESIWINFTTTATGASPSIELIAGGTYSEFGPVVTGEAISIYAATTGHAFTAKER